MSTGRIVGKTYRPENRGAGNIATFRMITLVSFSQRETVRLRFCGIRHSESRAQDRYRLA